MIHRFRRRGFVLLVALFLLGMTFHHRLSWLSASRLPNYESLVGFKKSDHESLNVFKKSDYKVRDSMHFSKYKFSLSDEFQASIGGWDAFATKSQTEKCEELFTFISSKMPLWRASSFKNRIYNKNVVNKAGYFKDNHRHIIKRMLPKSDINPELISDKDKQELDLWFSDALNSTVATEQEMADTMSIIRNFGHCFLNTNTGKSEKLDKIFKEFAPKVLPYFAKELPMVTSSVGRNSFFEDSPPFSKTSEFIDYYFNNIQGTGIVISVSTKHVRDLVKLIHVFRALGNELPIQVFHRLDISSSAKEALERAASAPKDELLSEDHSELKVLRSSLKSLGLDENSVHEREFPPQNLTLVDMHKPLSSMPRSEFSGYNNKIAALFFNSFERVLLLDADTVPLQSPKAFFELQEFIDTGAYFFKDRSLLDRNGWVETNFFAKLMPHDSNSLDMAMGVKPVTNHTMRNEYMQGWRHCQEAGVVVFDRKAHFSSTLVLLTLSLWGEPAKSSVWGDKEFYWLAMSIAGDERYAFNPISAASIGEITSNNDMKQYNTTKSLELCSSHPGHISPKGELLWINSGFSYCKMNSFVRDKSKFPYNLYEDKDEVRSLFESPLKIRHAIVPPSPPALRTLNGPADQRSEAKFVESLKSRKKDVDDLPNIHQLGDYGPQKGWVKSPLCSDYQYCAYSEIDSLDGSGGTDAGRVFTFEPEVTKTFDILGAIWISARRYTGKQEEKKAKSQERQSDQKNLAEAAVVFDPSKVLERPEKLNNDIKGVIAKLQSAALNEPLPSTN